MSFSFRRFTRFVKEAPSSALADVDRVAIVSESGDITTEATLAELAGANAFTSTFAPLASPTFTGNVVVPDADADNEALNRGTADKRLAPLTTYRLAGTNSSYISTPSAADIQLATKTTFEMTLKANADLLSGGSDYLFAKSEGAGQRCYDCYIHGSGELTFRISTDGTTMVDMQRTGVAAALGSTDEKVLTVTVDPNNGANSTLDVFVNGVQVSTQVTGTAVPTPFAGTETLKIGGRSSGTNGGMNLRRFRIINHLGAVIGDWQAGPAAVRFHDGTRVWTAAGANDGWVVSPFV